MAIETSEIKISPKKLLTLLAMEYGLSFIAISLGVALLIGATAIIFDARFWIVALIWIFIVIPMGMFLLFIIYGMLPLTTSNAVAHKIRFEKDRLFVIIPPTDSESNPTSREIEYSSIVKINSAGDSLVVFFNLPNKGLLWIPNYSFSDASQLKAVFGLLKPYCKIKSPVAIDYEDSEG